MTKNISISETSLVPRKINISNIIAKKCLFTGQEQACSRITHMARCLGVCHPAQIQKWDGNEEIAFKKFRKGQRMKKSSPIIRERESETFIPGNGREREFPLSPAISAKKNSGLDTL